MPTVRQVTRPCPNCGQTTSQVVNVRDTTVRGRPAARRRRTCRLCKYRQTTYEIEQSDLEKLLNEAQNEILRLKSKVAGWQAWDKKQK